jgi:hypothetical protein
MIKNVIFGAKNGEIFDKFRAKNINLKKIEPKRPI